VERTAMKYLVATRTAGAVVDKGNLFPSRAARAGPGPVRSGLQRNLPCSRPPDPNSSAPNAALRWCSRPDWVQLVTWLTPYQFSQEMPADVDFRIMTTFVEFYEVLEHRTVLPRSATPAGLRRTTAQSPPACSGLL
jgi:hypothetical protein